MLNNVIIMGRLTADPELKSTQGDISFCNFTVAVDRDFKNKDGEREADFIPCTAWRQTAEFICKYFSKGQAIAVHGTLQSRRYEDKDGNKRTAYDVVVANAWFAGDKPAEKNEPAPRVPGFKPPKGATVPDHDDDEFARVDDDDDLPF